MTLFWYIARGLLSSLAVAGLELGAVMLPPIVLSAVTRLGGVKPLTLLEYLPYMLVEIGPYAILVAFLVSVMRTYGRLQEQGEWTAIIGSGINPVRAFVPAWVGGAALTVLALLCHHAWFPSLRLDQENFSRSSVIEKIGGLMPGHKSISLGPASLTAMSREGNSFRNVLIRFSGEDARGDKWFTAKRVDARLEGKTLVLDCQGAQSLGQESSLAVDRAYFRFPLKELEAVEHFDRDRPKFLSSTELEKRGKDQSIDAGRRRLYLYEVQRRSASGVALLILLLVALPCGLWMRSESHVKSLMLGSLIGGLYFIAERFSESLVGARELGPTIGGWLPLLLGGAVGLVLLVRLASW